MTGVKRSVPEEKIVKKERTAGLVKIQEFLETKGIKSEKVLDFVCFEYKGEHFRVRSLADAKVAIGQISY